MSQPHEPARKVKQDPNPDNRQPRGVPGYPDVAPNEPGLMGGPATEAVPGSHADDPLPLPEFASPDAAATVTDDGGETTMPGRPRETGGERPSADIHPPPGTRDPKNRGGA